MEKSGTFFLCLDIGDQISGIESAVLNRTKLFSRVGLKSTIVTSAYNSDLHTNLNKWKAQGRVSDQSMLINLYDYVQGSTDFQGEGHFGFESDSSYYKVSPVENSKDSRLYDRSGNFAGYVKRRSNDSIHYVNHLTNGRVTRRETFDSRGFLSRVDQIEFGTNSESILELYLRPNGTIALEKETHIAEGKIENLELRLLTSSGELQRKFTSHEALMQFFLESLLEENESPVFVIDRSTEYFKPLITLKSKADSQQFSLIPVIHNSHAGGDVFVGPVNGYYKEVFENLNLIDGLIVLSHGQKRDFELRFSNTKIFVIPNSHETVNQTRDAHSRSRNKIVYLARYMPEKQHHLAVEIMSKVIERMPEVKLSCYGFGTGKADLVKLIESKNLQSTIFINDYDLNVAELYQDASISILTSSVEGFCQGLLESLFYGCPAIAFDVKYGNSEMIEDGQNGFLVEHANVEKFADKIIEVLSNNDLRQNLTKYAPSSVEKYSHENVSVKWQEFVRHFNTV